LIEDKRLHIYLSGNISANRETYLWRMRFTEAVKDLDVVTVDPCLNNFNQRLSSDSDGDGAEFKKLALQRSQGLLPLKDFQLMKGCQLTVVNLALITPEKPPIGTIHELCWCEYVFNMPVIAIVGEEVGFYARHPFNAKCISAHVRDEQEAATTVRDFFCYSGPDSQK